MEDKKSFLMFYDWEPLFQFLDDEDVGAMLKALFAYEIRNEWPKYEDLNDSAWGVFQYLAARLDENRKRWQKMSERGSKAGKASGEARRNKNEQEGNNDEQDTNKNEQERTNANKNKPKDKDKDKDKVKDVLSDDKTNIGTTSNKSKPSTVRFVPPSVEDVRVYCLERNNRVDADAFVSFYESNGWRVGKNPMKDWKAAVRTWEKRTNELHANALNTVQPKKSDDFVDLDKMRADPKYAFIFANERRVD